MSIDVEDGFGNGWSKCLRRDCDLQVVRPGKAQCNGDWDGIGCPFDQDELVESLAVARDRIEQLERRP